MSFCTFPASVFVLGLRHLVEAYRPRTHHYPVAPTRWRRRGLTAVPKEEGEPMKVGNNLRYRFSVSVDGSPFRIVRDYSSRSVFAWRPELYDHEARVKVAVLNIESKETGEVELPFRVTSRVVDQSLWRLSTAIRSSRCSALLRVLTVASFVWLSNGEAIRWFPTALDSSPAGLPAATICMSRVCDRIPNTCCTRKWLPAATVQSGPAVPFRTGIADGNFGRSSYPSVTTRRTPP